MEVAERGVKVVAVGEVCVGVLAINRSTLAMAVSSLLTLLAMAMSSLLTLLAMAVASLALYLR